MGFWCYGHGFLFSGPVGVDRDTKISFGEVLLFFLHQKWMYQFWYQSIVSEICDVCCACLLYVAELGFSLLFAFFLPWISVNHESYLIWFRNRLGFVLFSFFVGCDCIFFFYKPKVAVFFKWSFLTWLSFKNHKVNVITTCKYLISFCKRFITVSYWL